MFGIASAPENYQKIVKDVLRDCKGAANIADDVIVHGRGVKEHDENLFAVLNRLKECGLTLNGSKCKFRLPRLTFYGHDLGKQGITPNEEKIDAIVNAQSPKNASEVISFLGLVQHSAKFLPNFAEVAEPLRILTRKDQKFTWERFHLYVYGREFELETDHKPLECIYSRTSKPSARIERWVFRLQGYQYKVTYRPGKTNIADALSRLNQGS